MNINETYIKMCEKARELWDSRKFEEGDCVVAKGSDDGMKDGLHIAGYDFTIDDQLAYGGKWFAVFRQFQLQRMVKRDNESWRALDIRFNSFAEKLPIYNVWTHEQRWLAFVMKEKFNKVWNGNDWIPTKMVP